jgi:hypothetical protein
MAAKILAHRCGGHEVLHLRESQHRSSHVITQLLDHIAMQGGRQAAPEDHHYACGNDAEEELKSEIHPVKS